MKVTRHNVFETNSSSTHSISITNEVELLESMTPDENGNIVLTGGEFGWEWEKITDPLTKASYCAVDKKMNIDSVMNKKDKEMLIKVLKEQTGANDIIFNFSDEYSGPNWSYLDHQSEGTSNVVFVNEETLRNFIFNPKCILFIGNDNEMAPINFYDSEDKQYDYIVKLEGCNIEYKITEEELNEEIDEKDYHRSKIDDMIHTLWSYHPLNEYNRNRESYISIKGKLWYELCWGKEKMYDLEKREVYIKSEEWVYEEDEKGERQGKRILKDKKTLELFIIKIEK